MARYIAAEAVKAKKVYCEERHEYVIPVSEIDWQPAADVAPVAHGQWVESDIPGSMLSKCTVCGFRCGAYTFNFCPHCGAKMDGKA